MMYGRFSSGAYPRSTGVRCATRSLSPGRPLHLRQSPRSLIDVAECQQILDRLASMPLDQRREVPGLHPDRAPTIVAGAVILIEALKFFGLDQVEISEHDILRGAALGLT